MPSHNFRVKNGLEVAEHVIVQGNITFAGSLVGDGSGLTGAGVSSYNDLTDKPAIPSAFSDLTDDVGYATESYVTVALSNLVDSAPGALDTLNELAAALGDDANFASTVANSLALKANISSLSSVALSGSYVDLTNKPTLFSGSYVDLTNKPTLFSGSYNDLSDTPSLFSGSYVDLTNKPTLFSGSYNDLSDLPSLFSGSYNDLSDTPSLFSGSYADLTNKPTLYTDSDTASYLTSNSYATQTWVTSQNYLTAESDTLDSVTDRGNTTTNSITVGDFTSTGNVQIDGNLTVSGTTVTINATNLAVEDNMIYLNNGNSVANPDLGIAGNYNDGTYAHAGVFRDATDGIWKFYDSYTLEPDASAYIDTAHASFALADVQANTFIGNLTGNATTATSATTATKWATGRTISLTGDVTGTSGSFDGSGNLSFATNIAANTIGITELNVSDGTSGQVLTTNGAGTLSFASVASAYGDADVDAHLSGGTGISYAAGVITNTAPDQTVSLTAGSNVTITGTYPSFTIASTDTNTTYSIATSTVPGLIELFSDTDQSITPNAVTATAGRTYGIQLNAANQAVVNVPWTDTNTTYSAGTGVTLAGTTFSIGQVVATSSNVQFNSLGIGTAGSGTAGEIRATNNITAYYSDKRLKENIKSIDNALDKVQLISGVTFNANDEAAKYGYTDKKTQVGVIAQEIEQVLPEIVVAAPFDIAINDDGTEYSKSGENYKTVQYEKIVPLLIEAIKELKQEIDILKGK